MLELKKITKSYTLEKNSDLPVLKGIDLVFEDTGFVAILGPSGCGKTTLLNIVGGLDRYTDGDLQVDGVSTKYFKDRDWDNYRNRRIGIVFQNYNLISHLSVLSNVELAMTLSGVAQRYRRKKATKALLDVGLGDTLSKKPNQLSGGQMQRVAIARAIVNNPGVILADEPTGALDSKTSAQIMDILKELSKTHLVIMVTHNEELADSYATRILRMRDGLITADESREMNAPTPRVISTASTIDGGAADLTLIDTSFSEQIQDELAHSRGRAKKEQTSMSFPTALNISTHNLLTKKGRTSLTAIAGSFGIIGVALVLSLSNGFKHYITRMETETLSQFPISVEKYGLPDDINIGHKDDLDAYPDSDEIFVQKPQQTTLHVNTITDEYVAYLDDMDQNLVNSIKYNYSVQLNAVTIDTNQNPLIISTTPNSMLSSITSSSYWSELPGDEEFIRSQYDVIGEYPKNKGELLISVDKYNRISYSTMQALGFDVTMDASQSSKTYTFDDLLDKTYKIFENDDLYDEHSAGTKTGIFLKEEANLTRFTQLLAELYDLYVSGDESDAARIKEIAKEMTAMFEAETSTKELKYYTKKGGQDLKDLYASEKGEDMKIVGILRPKDTTAVDLLSYGVYYTQELTSSVLEANSKTAVASELKNHCFVNYSGNIPTFNYFTTLGDFKSTDLAGYSSERLMAGTDKDITSITIFPKSFDEKKKILSYLDAYNDGKGDSKIIYTDLASVLTSSVGNMIDIISIVLICFAAVALVTSSVMIGIITYTSVLERTKEIGILRSIGARKKDVSRLFLAESVIIGLLSGLIGIVVTYILCFPINAILNGMFPDISIGNIAMLDPLAALILIAISILLTFISGLIPSRVASKKDPVVCLRTE